HHQLEPQTARLSRRAALGEARRAPGRRREGRVAAAALAAPRDQRDLPHLDEVGDHLAGVAVRRARAHGNVDVDVLAVLAGALPALALAAGAGLVRRPAHELVERGDVVDGAQVHRPAVPAAAAVGPALGDVLQAQERQAAVAALAALHRDVENVAERHHWTA